MLCVGNAIAASKAAFKYSLLYVGNAIAATQAALLMEFLLILFFVYFPVYLFIS